MDKDHILLEYDVVVTLPRHYLIIQTNVVIMHTLARVCMQRSYAYYERI